MELTFLSGRAFDLFLSLGVTTPLLNQPLALIEELVFEELVMVW